MKKCSKCQEFKELDEFPRRSKSKDGRDGTCSLCKSKMDKSWRANNKEKKSAIDKEWRTNNALHLTTYFREYKRNRRNSDPMTRLKDNLQRRIHKALKGEAKSFQTVVLLGAPVSQVMVYMERLFQPGMTWDNYGEWHVDHKVPVASAKSKKELEKLFHYTNLQPLWASDNLKKSDRMPEPNLNGNEFVSKAG